MNDITKIDTNFKLQTIDKTDVKLYNVREEPFVIYGHYAPESDELFRRVPLSVASAMSEGAAALHTNTAGVRVRFKTDSPYVAIRATVPWLSHMPNMTIMGSAGFDLYADGHFVGNFAPPVNYQDTFRATVEFSESFEGIINFPDKKFREIQINFPLYSNVSDVFIGLSETASLEKGAEYKYKKPIVFYGSSITQGGCASRPGNSYQAILSRRFDSNFINLGFSGNARAEDAIAEYISSLDMSIFVYDYDHNAPTIEHLRKTHKPMFDKIRKAQPNLPIIMLSKPDRSKADEIEARCEIIYSTYKSAKDSGDENVYYINGQDIFNFIDSDMMTVDGCHPNDFGFYCMMKKLEPIIAELLK